MWLLKFIKDFFSIIAAVALTFIVYYGGHYLGYQNGAREGVKAAIKTFEEGMQKACTDNRNMEQCLHIVLAVNAHIKGIEHEQKQTQKLQERIPETQTRS